MTLKQIYILLVFMKKKIMIINI